MIVNWTELGAQAFEAGEPMAPVLNPLVVEALCGLPVGTVEAKNILTGYTAGWQHAHLAQIAGHLA